MNITPQERKALAQELGMSEPYLYQLLTARRDMSPGEARKLEVRSGGRLPREWTCQKTWREIWPELEGRALPPLTAAIQATEQR